MAKKKETPKSNQNPFIVTKVPDPSENGGDEAAMSAARQTISRPGLKLGEHKELIELTLQDIVKMGNDSPQTLGRIAHNKVTTAATSMARLELDKRRAAREAQKKSQRLIVRAEETEETMKEQKLDESCAHDAYCKYHKRAGSSVKNIASHLDRHAYLTNKVNEKAAKKGYNSQPDHHAMKNIADQLEALELQLAQDNEWKNDMNKPVKAIKEEEQLAEISKKTLGSYINKASEDQSDQRAAMKDQEHAPYTNVRDWNKSLKKHQNRKAGIKKAVSKLTKEEHLDEVSKKTLGSYITKASEDQSDQRAAMKDQEHAPYLNARDYRKSLKKHQNRKAGIKKAVAKLTAESSVLTTLKKVIKEASGDMADLQQKQKAETKTLQKKHVQQDISVEKKALDDKAKKKMDKLEQ